MSKIKIGNMDHVKLYIYIYPTSKYTNESLLFNTIVCLYILKACFKLVLEDNFRNDLIYYKSATASWIVG